MENEILASHVIPRIFVCGVILRRMFFKKREKVFCLMLEKSPGSFIIAYNQFIDNTPIFHVRLESSIFILNGSVEKMFV